MATVLYDPCAKGCTATLQLATCSSTCFSKHSLLSSDITELRLKSVQNRLQDFVDIWENLYGMFNLWIFIEFEEGPAYTLHTLACVHIGAEHCTINLHLLLHMSDHVRSFGPLWTHSCFEFEAANFTLIKKFMAELMLRSR